MKNPHHLPVPLHKSIFNQLRTMDIDPYQDFDLCPDTPDSLVDDDVGAIPPVDSGPPRYGSEIVPCIHELANKPECFLDEEDVSRYVDYIATYFDADSINKIQTRLWERQLRRNHQKRLVQLNLETNRQLINAAVSASAGLAANGVPPAEGGGEHDPMFADMIVVLGEQLHRCQSQLHWMGTSLKMTDLCMDNLHEKYMDKRLVEIKRYIKDHSCRAICVAFGTPNAKKVVNIPEDVLAIILSCFVSEADIYWMWYGDLRRDMRPKLLFDFSFEPEPAVGKFFEED